MPNLTGKTLAELRTMSKAGIIAAMTGWCNAQSKKQLIEFEMDANEFADAPVITQRPDKQVATREQTVRDVLGAVVRTERTDHSYYDTGEIDEITHVVKNAGGDEIGDKYIKHYKDKQPEGQFVLTVVLAPQDVSGITAPMPANYWRLINVGAHASLWAVDAPPAVLLNLHSELWAMNPAGTFGVLAVASARGNFFLPAAVRHHTSMTVQQALERRNRIANYLDGLGCNTMLLRQATNEQMQVEGIVAALGYAMNQLWVAMGR